MNWGLHSTFSLLELFLPNKPQEQYSFVLPFHYQQQFSLNLPLSLLHHTPFTTLVLVAPLFITLTDEEFTNALDKDDSEITLESFTSLVSSELQELNIPIKGICLPLTIRKNFYYSLSMYLLN